MGKFVTPKVFMVGATSCAGDFMGIRQYLEYTGNMEFLIDIQDAINSGLSYPDILCSMFAKLCYKSLTVGKNPNISSTRSIAGNIAATMDSAHGSVFEHASLNFIITDCSRVFTHEAVRHRAGTAFSQTSGRYCRLDKIDLVWDPILEPVKYEFTRCMAEIEKTIYVAECKLGLREPTNTSVMSDEGFNIQTPFGWPDPEQMWVPVTKGTGPSFERRKKITSALRRLAPNGQSNELALTLNIRALRHFIQVRTAPAAEWEMRLVAAQIAQLVQDKYPLMLHGSKMKLVDGIPHFYGMHLQPYEVRDGDKNELWRWSTPDLQEELASRVQV